MSYENGDIDYVKLTGDLVNQYRNEEGFSTQIGGYIWNLTPNCENEYLSNVNLRRCHLLLRWTATPLSILF